MKDITLITLAAGNSTRFKKPVKKQWLRVGEVPLWEFVTNSIASYYDFKEIIVVANPFEAEVFRSITDFRVVSGGAERQDSIKNALKEVKTDFVLITDIARSCISKDVLKRVIESEADCVVPFVKTPDTTLLGEDILDRDELKLIQTPQLSKTETLKNAIENSESYFTDESTLIKHFGGEVSYVEGSWDAKKITFGEEIKDLACIEKPSKESFIGYGFDVHGFEKGKQMVLCGVDIESNLGFKAHSDGDVALHALIDALLGAAGLGDIGEWFPDTDERYKNADSKVLLKDSVDLLYRFGYEAIGADITIMAEKPKLKKYKTAMKKKVASLLNIRSERVNVKATTTEKLGFVGRSEGVAVSAVASIKFFDWSK